MWIIFFLSLNVYYCIMKWKNREEVGKVASCYVAYGVRTDRQTERKYVSEAMRPCRKVVRNGDEKSSYSYKESNDRMSWVVVPVYNELQLCCKSQLY